MHVFIRDYNNDFKMRLLSPSNQLSKTRYHRKDSRVFTLISTKLHMNLQTTTGPCKCAMFEFQPKQIFPQILVSLDLDVEVSFIKVKKVRPDKF